MLLSYCQNGLDDEVSAREGWTNKMFFVISWIFFKSRAQLSLHVQRLQPLLKENGHSQPKALTEVPKVQASSEVWGYGPPKKPWSFALVSLKWQFRHFHIIFVVFCKVFIIITDVFGLFFAVVKPVFRNREIPFTAFTPWLLWKIIINLMCTRHKCIQRKATLARALLYTVLSSQTL